MNRRVFSWRGYAEIMLAVVAVALSIFTIAPIVYMAITGDFPGAHAFYGLEEDSPPVGWILDLHRAVTAR